MKPILVSFLACLAALHVRSTAVSRNPIVREHEDLVFPTAKRLYPASIPAALRHRGLDSGLLKGDTTFEYVENPGSLAVRSDSTVFATTLKVKGYEKILSLEDLESDVLQVKCFSSKIELDFIFVERFNKVSEELTASGTFVVVTSHPDCNEEDERAPHIVSKVDIERREKRIILYKTKTNWKRAFASTEVLFARKPATHVVRRWHQSFKRQDEPAQTMKLPFPSAPTSTDLPPNTSTELDMKLMDQVIMPPETPITGFIVPENVKLLCKMCALQGKIDLSQGSFQLDEIDGAKDVISNSIKFFNQGSIELDVDGLYAQIELALNLDSEVPVEFSIPLPVIPLSPFAIPGLVTFGAFVRPQISVSMQFDQDIEFSYGFNASVPNGSKFVLDIGQPGNSTVTGFQDATFQALPFQSQKEFEKLSFKFAFNPEILLGVHSIVGRTTGGIGMFFNLPEVAVNVTKLNDVDQNCDPKTTAKGRRSDHNDRSPTSGELFGNFTNIHAEVEYNLGPIAELEVDLNGFEASFVADTPILSKSFPLPTGCVAFDDKTKSYGNPVEIVMGEHANKKFKSDAERVNVYEPSKGTYFPALLAFIAVLFSAWL